MRFGLHLPCAYRHLKEESPISLLWRRTSLITTAYLPGTWMPSLDRSDENASRSENELSSQLLAPI